MVLSKLAGAWDGHKWSSLNLQVHGMGINGPLSKLADAWDRHARIEKLRLDARGPPAQLQWIMHVKQNTPGPQGCLRTRVNKVFQVK
jgi:hypothetical protein